MSKASSDRSEYSFHSSYIGGSPSERASFGPPAAPSPSASAGGTPSAASASGDEIAPEDHIMSPDGVSDLLPGSAAESHVHPHYFPDGEEDSPSRAPTPLTPVASPAPVEVASPDTAPNLLSGLSSWGSRHSAVVAPGPLPVVSWEEFDFMNAIEARQDGAYLGTTGPGKWAPIVLTPMIHFDVIDARRTFVERVAAAREIGARFRESFAEAVAASSGVKRSARIAGLELDREAHRSRKDDENTPSR